MADGQATTQAISQVAIKAAKATVQAMAVTRAEAGTGLRCGVVSMEFKLDRLSLKQQSFDMSAKEKSAEQKFSVEGK